MGAEGKLDRLRTEWILYASFCSVLAFAVGDYRLFDVALRIGVTAALAWYLIRELQQKSSLVWAFGVAFGVLNAIGSAIAFVVELRGGTPDVRVLAMLASVVINIRMFRVLRDPEVKHHVMSG